MIRVKIKRSCLGALKRVRRGAQLLAGHGEEAVRLLLDSHYMGWLIGPRAGAKRKAEKLEGT